MKYNKFNVSLTTVPVTKSLVEKFKTLKQIREVAKKISHSTVEGKLYRNRIKELKEEIKNTNQTEFIVTVKNKRSEVRAVFDTYPCKYSYKDIIDTFVSELRDVRKERKQTNYETRKISGFKYQVVGGVFTNSNSILSLKDQVDPLERIRASKSPHPMIKHKYVGIELEFLSKISKNEIEQLFIQEKLEGCVNIKGDASIRTEEEWPNGVELTVLCRQDQVEDIITRICKVLNGDQVKARVNNSCGMHLHIDMRNRDAYKSYTNLVKSLPMLSRMVPSNRLGAWGRRYCALNETADLAEYYPNPEDMSETTDELNRYLAVNPEALSKFKTLEVRLHSGTVNKKKIINWVKICCSIVDKNEVLERDIENADDFRTHICDDHELWSYIESRTLFFAKDSTVDTTFDHTFDLVSA